MQIRSTVRFSDGAFENDRFTFSKKCSTSSLSDVTSLFELNIRKPLPTTNASTATKHPIFQTLFITHASPPFY